MSNEPIQRANNEWYFLYEKLKEELETAIKALQIIDNHKMGQDVYPIQGYLMLQDEADTALKRLGVKK